MATSPPASPARSDRPRPRSALIRPSRPTSRMSISSRPGDGADEKTSVRVGVRVRPPLQPSDPGYELIPQRFQRPMVQVTAPTSLAVDSPQGRKLFVFDQVWGADAPQDAVWDYVAPGIDSFVQGYNVSIMAYGQSGAGKSYTMGTSGPLEQGDSMRMGVISRAAKALLEKLLPSTSYRTSTGMKPPNRYSMSAVPTLNTASNPPAERKWQLKATYVEIYNEQLRDLLIPDNVPPQDRSAVTIREDARGRILLTGLHAVTINSIDDLLNALNFGSTIRQTDATAINAQSSRSHAVFTLNLIQRKSKTVETSVRDKRRSMPIDALATAPSESSITVDSKLHFVDLAGSERLKNTGASGDRAREGISINAGLASLGKVIAQLSSRTSSGSVGHVSYRDSKLTRLLQDSLGGSAITYLIACVTPVEFHLSETLNTVQYAQRARAIQSKPKIQQLSDDSDKQALIDRLRAEITFLRDQVRQTSTHGPHSSHSGRNVGGQPLNAVDREVELQHQLLDAQENYGALSQRHAKLIAEISRTREGETPDVSELANLARDEAAARIQRSTSFADAVENVVLEYEKTIQSLETSLTKTRSSLSTTESSLLERETRCAYVETLNAQLQTRLQKLIDRESSTESYLHDLEARINGGARDEEKSASAVLDLRKELARLRETEATAEEYIATLEERLAEADQDAELMNRELGRLEQVVERQRSVGKLDHLLHEFDQMGPQALGSGADMSGASAVATNGHAVRPLPSSTRPAVSLDDGSRSGIDVTIPESEEEHQHPAVANAADLTRSSEQDTAQADFVAEKLETVNQELVDLRMEHDATVNDYDLLAAKYDEALRTLAALQEAVDDSRASSFASPTAFLANGGGVARTSQDQSHPHPHNQSHSHRYQDSNRRSSLIAGAPSPFSRSLSSELSSAGASRELTDGESTAATGESLDSLGEVDEATKDSTYHPHANDTQFPTGQSFREDQQALKSAQHSPSDEAASTVVAPTRSASSELGPTHAQDLSQKALTGDRLDQSQELAQLRSTHAETQHSLQELQSRYTTLHEQHLDAMHIVEALKAEVHKAKTAPPASPGGFVRRKSSQNLLGLDRAHRSLASMGNIAAENLAERPEVKGAFEANLNNVMHELHQRSERVQELEGELTGVRKEMEHKVTIIAGLTRERSSLKNQSPLDMGVLSSLREELLQTEHQLQVLQESSTTRELGLTEEIASLKETLAAQSLGATNNASGFIMPGALPITPSEQQTAADEATQARLLDLQRELASWEDKHRMTVETMQTTQEHLHANIADLQKSLQQHTTESARGQDRTGDAGGQTSKAQEFEQRYAELQAAHEATQRDLTAATSLQHDTNSHLDEYRAQIASLEMALQQHQTDVHVHQDQLRDLQTAHATRVEDLHASHAEKIRDLEQTHAMRFDELEQTTREKLRADLQTDQEALETQHRTAIQALEQRSRELEQELQQTRSTIANNNTSASSEHAQVNGLGISTALGSDDAFASPGVPSTHALLSPSAPKAHLDIAPSGDEPELDETRNKLQALEAAQQQSEATLAQTKAQVQALTTARAEQDRELAVLREKEQRASRLVEELEGQLSSTFEDSRKVSSRISLMQSGRDQELAEARAATTLAQEEARLLRHRVEQLESSPRGVIGSGDAGDRSSSLSAKMGRSTPVNSLPTSPPPAIPLPPLPTGALGSPPASPPTPSTSVFGPFSPSMGGLTMSATSAAKEAALTKRSEEQDARIRTIEKSLYAEKQLTSTLEEALVDLEAQVTKSKKELDGWKRKAWDYEDEMAVLRQERTANRHSLQAVQEERSARIEAEAARAHLEERMAALNRKKKKSALNCF